MVLGFKFGGRLNEMNEMKWVEKGRPWVALLQFWQGKSFFFAEFADFWGFGSEFVAFLYPFLNVVCFCALFGPVLRSSSRAGDRRESQPAAFFFSGIPNVELGGRTPVPPSDVPMTVVGASTDVKHLQEQQDFHLAVVVALGGGVEQSTGLRNQTVTPGVLPSRLGVLLDRWTLTLPCVHACAFSSCDDN